jgi:tight adherence protein C
MVWGITAITFIATAAILMALFYALAPGEGGMASRLSRLINPVVPVEAESFADKQKDRVRTSLASLGKMVPGDAKQTPRSQLMMARAGYRNPEAIMAIRGLKLLMPVALVGLVFFTGVYRVNPFFMVALAAILGYLIPEMWLLWRVSSRQKRLRRALPDGLDLLVICVEAGLGLDQAFMKVAEELRIAHPELSEELHLVNLEMRIGKTRLEALRELARRTGLEDIKSLVAMLIQTDRFGTSVAQSLRVYSDELRVKRRQRAEEMSAKTSVKMVPPLVFFIFPALMVVILGPAVITLMRQMMPALQK